MRYAILLATILTLALSGSARAYEDFKTVPTVYSQNLGAFKSLIDAANTRTVRIAIWGDSQETSPGGAGRVYIPRMNYEAWKVYGNCPETPFVGGGSYANPSEWLMRGAVPANGPTATGTDRLAANKILPGVTPYSSYALGSNNQYYGQMSMVNYKGEDLPTGSNVPTTNTYFKTDGTIKAEIFAATNASSGEIAWKYRPRATNAVSFFETEAANGTMNLGLQSSTFAVKSGLTPALAPVAGKPYIQLEVSGTSTTAKTDVVGVRFRNESHPEGMVFTDLAAGGYNTDHILNSHSECGPMYKALGFDAAMIHTGVNDASHGYSVEKYKTDVTAVVARLREWMNDPNYKVILVAEADLKGLSVTQRANFDQYAGALYAIAQADPNVMVLNTRRLLHEQKGWDASQATINQYLADNVHYSALGGITVAEVEMNALQSIPEPAAAVTLLAGGALLTLCRRR